MPEEAEEARLGKLGRAVGAAARGIHEGEEAFGGLVQKVAIEHDGGAGAGLLKVGHQRGGIGGDGGGVVAIYPGDFAEHVDKGGPAEARGLGEIGAAPDRLAGGGQEHGQRPAALLSGGVKRGHVDLVDIRPLLTVDLDVHEKLVHDRGGCGILEAFVSHHMAPVTGGIADGKKDGPVARGRLGQRGRAPGAPVDGVVLVLEEIGAGFVAEQVFVHRSDVG